MLSLMQPKAWITHFPLDFLVFFAFEAALDDERAGLAVEFLEVFLPFFFVGGVSTSSSTSSTSSSSPSSWSACTSALDRLPLLVLLSQVFFPLLFLALAVALAVDFAFGFCFSLSGAVPAFRAFFPVLQ